MGFFSKLRQKLEQARTQAEQQLRTKGYDIPSKEDLWETEELAVENLAGFIEEKPKEQVESAKTQAKDCLLINL